MNSFCKAPKLTSSVLSEIENAVRSSKDKQFSDEDLLTLHSVYGTVLQRALDILEKHSLIEVYITANKSRSLLELKGENNHCYRIFPDLNFCPCQSFKHQVLEKKVQLTCKHVLAGWIATVLNKTKFHQVTQEQYQMLVRSMFEFDH